MAPTCYCGDRARDCRYPQCDAPLSRWRCPRCGTEWELHPAVCQPACAARLWPSSQGRRSQICGALLERQGWAA